MAIDLRSATGTGMVPSNHTSETDVWDGEITEGSKVWHIVSSIMSPYCDGGRGMASW